MWIPQSHADLRRLVGGQRRVRVEADSWRQRNTPYAPPAIPGQENWNIETRVISRPATEAAAAALVCGARSHRPNFSCEEDQRRSDQAGAPYKPAPIEKAYERPLLLYDSLP